MGQVVSWGSNGSGQLGIGDDNNRSLPTGTGIADAVSVSAGSDFSLALLADGDVDAWGANADGQLGNGGHTGSTLPVQVDNLTGVIAISAGGQHAMALLSNGTVWTWGDDGNGELGNGVAGADSPIPVEVITTTGPLSSISAIAAGYGHDLALNTSGSVWAWGQGGQGELGNQTTSDSATPVRVPIGDIQAIAAEADGSLALQSNETVLAWGFDAAGEVGNGTVGTTGCECVDSPALVLTGSYALGGVTAIAGANERGMAIVNGTVWEWGYNADGELGSGVASNNPATCECISSAIEAMAAPNSALTGALGLATGSGNDTAVLTRGGLLWTWGTNASGQLGDGDFTGSVTPVRVQSSGGGDLQAVISVAAGSDYMLAVVGPAPSASPPAPTPTAAPTQAATKAAPVRSTPTPASLPPAAPQPTSTVRPTTTTLPAATLLPVATAGVAAINSAPPPPPADDFGLVGGIFVSRHPTSWALAVAAVIGLFAVVTLLLTERIVTAGGLRTDEDGV